MTSERKISETLLEFAASVVSAFEGELSPEAVRPAFIVAITAWNAVIFDESERGTNCFEQARSQLGTGPERELFDSLVRRKKEEFASDRRLIGDFEVYSKRGELRLRAVAHAPPAVGRGVRTTRLFCHFGS